MFIQARCLYVIGSDRHNSEKIYSSLDSLGLIDKLFESQKNKKEVLKLKIWALITFSQYKITILEVFDQVS